MRGRELRFLVKVLCALIDELKRLMEDNDFDTEQDKLEVYHFEKTADVFYTYLNEKSSAETQVIYNGTNTTLNL